MEIRAVALMKMLRKVANQSQLGGMSNTGIQRQSSHQSLIKTLRVIATKSSPSLKEVNK